LVSVADHMLLVVLSTMSKLTACSCSHSPSETYIGEKAFPSLGPYSFINVSGEEYQMQGGSFANKTECVAVCHLIQKMKKNPGWDSPNMLRIITFYQGQVTLLQRLLAQKGFPNVLVATVDSSQVRAVF
jgi:hypothetical protein